MFHCEAAQERVAQARRAMAMMAGLSPMTIPYLNRLIAGKVDTTHRVM